MLFLFTSTKFAADCFVLFLNSICCPSASTFLFQFASLAVLDIQFLAKDCADKTEVFH